MAQLTVTFPDSVVTRIQAAFNNKPNTEIVAWLKHQLKNQVKRYEIELSERQKEQEIDREVW